MISATMDVNMNLSDLRTPPRVIFSCAPGWSIKKDLIQFLWYVNIIMVLSLSIPINRIIYPIFFSDEYGCVHVSSGALLRQAIEEGTRYGREAKMYMKRGEMMPDESMSDIILERLQQDDCVNRGWILDGFPRTTDQARALVNTGIICDIYVTLDVPENMIFKSVINQQSDEKSRAAEDEIQARLVLFKEYSQIIAPLYQSVIAPFDGTKDFTVLAEEMQQLMERRYKYNVTFFVGRMNAGITTVCERLMEKGNYERLCVHELMSAEVSLHRDASSSIGDAFETASTKRIISMIEKKMKSSACNHFFIEGFPCSIDQLNAWYAFLSSKCNLDLAVYLERQDPSFPSDSSYWNDINPVLETLDTLGILRVVQSDAPYDDVSELIKGSQLILPYQRTLAIVKPDVIAAGRLPEVFSAILENQIAAVTSMTVLMTVEAVNGFYINQKDDINFPHIKKYLTSGPSYVMVLEGRNVRTKWDKIVKLLRERVVQVDAKNSFHGSVSSHAFYKECNFWFNARGIGLKSCVENYPKSPAAELSGFKKWLPMYGGCIEDTCAILMPFLVKNSYSDVLSVLKAHGYQIISEARTTLNEAGFKIFAEDKKLLENEALKTHFLSGPVIVLQLRKTGAIKSFQHLIGPASPEVACKIRSDSLCSMFSTGFLFSTIYGSGFSLEATRDLSFFFRLSGIVSSIDSTSTLANGSVTKRSSGQKQLLTSSPVKKSGLATPMVSLGEKKEMLDYLRKDIGNDLSGFITRTVIQRPSNFYEFGVNDFTDQLKRQSLKIPEGKSPVKKLAPLQSQSTLALLQPELLNLHESSGEGYSNDDATSMITVTASASSTDLIHSDVSSPHGILYNQSAMLFTSLEDAKMEIENLKSVISKLSLNIRG